MPRTGVGISLRNQSQVASRPVGSCDADEHIAHVQHLGLPATPPRPPPPP
eukprot:CAMPEP_0182540318 /NCGR_PEP_ID=MMETSP1323-20130603/26852_1 /TAXON_ID=236787 /ORGANISM="Florenciella parvula, Strain RCC1693" /LENGTH=49 /DNA_ID= /DNA_START= /DNA_END= /DNA_ORIENTATION=